LPPELSAKDLPGGRTQILNVRQIRRIDNHAVESDEDSAPESISETENWLNRNADLYNPIDSKVDLAAGVESEVERENRIENLERPNYQYVSAAPNVPALIRPTQSQRDRLKSVSDCQYNGNEEELGNPEKVGRTASISLIRLFR